MPVQSTPDGYHSVTPHLIVHDGLAALEFYKNCFGATEVLRIDGTNGRIGHAEIMIGDSHVMLADEHPEMGFVSPRTIGGTGSSLMIYTEHVDEMFRRAVDNGAEQLRPVADQFYGDRTGTLKDPFGHIWTIATHVEDVSPEEIGRRMAATGSDSDSAT